MILTKLLNISETQVNPEYNKNGIDNISIHNSTLIQLVLLSHCLPSFTEGKYFTVEIINLLNGQPSGSSG